MNKKINQYILLEKIGDGGMGVVYKALDTRLNRIVALKFLRREFTQNTELTQRLFKEAQTLSQLDHPNICTVYSFEETPTGEIFIVMPYYNGSLLKDLLKIGMMELDQILDIGIQIANGVSAAHKLGIVHRDIKPENIVIRPDNIVKILDFGLAVMINENRYSDKGNIVGTIHYMAPEQILGDFIDNRADIWSLGIVLYEMVCNRIPFQGEYPITVYYRILNEEISFYPKHRPSVPNFLKNIITRATSKNATDRFTDMNQMLEALRSVQTKLLQGESFYGAKDFIRDMDQEQSTPVVQERTQNFATKFPLIPRSASRFIGRTSELARIKQDLMDPECRILTLLGSCGVGKTRLAIETARENANLFPDGVFFVPLAAVSGMGAVLSAIAETMGFSFFGKEQPLVQLSNFLYHKSTLIILDNFEHIIEFSDIITNLVERCPRIKIIVTSQQRLNLTDEYIIDVDGLGYSKAGDISDEAFQLFVHRSQMIKQDFTLTEEDRQNINRICSRIGGVPLAIELAASWIKKLSCKQIADEMEKSSQFLVSPYRDITGRHRSLEATFNYSWDLLSPMEQNIFRRLAVFKGSFTAQAASIIAATSLKNLSIFVDKSLLRSNDRNRYEMQPIIYEFVSSKLHENPEEKKTLSHQHSLYFMEVADEKRKKFYSDQLPDALQSVAEDLPNLIQGWEWSLAQGNIPAADIYLDTLYRFFEIRSRLIECEDLLAKSVRTLNKGLPINTIRDKNMRILAARIQIRQAAACYRLNFCGKAKPLLTEALSILNDENAVQDIAFALTYQGAIANRQKQFEAGITYLTDATERFRIVNDIRGKSIAYHHLGLIYMDLQKLDDAIHYHEESYQFAKQLNNLFGMSISLNILGTIACRQKDYERAREFHSKGETICQKLGDSWGISQAKSGLAEIAMAVGDIAMAKDFYLLSIQIDEKIGENNRLPNTLKKLANLLLDEHHYEESEKYFLKLLEIHRRNNDKLQIWECLHGLGVVFLNQNRLTECWDIINSCLYDSAHIPEIKDRMRSLMEQLEMKPGFSQTDQQSKFRRIRPQDEIVFEILKFGTMEP